MLKNLKKKFKSRFDYGEALASIESQLNLVTNQNSHLQARLAQIESGISGLGGNASQGGQLAVSEQLNALRKSEIRLMGLLSRANTSLQKAGVVCPAPISVDFQGVLEEFKIQNPALFPVWHQLFENGAKAYAKTKIGNCSHNELEPALLFRDVIDTFARGTVLDVGCGPYDVPSYLMSFDLGAICGLEPLPLLTNPSYRVERGFGERIPWQEASFDTVVSGAALDHAFSLDRTLDEIRRVLKPNGKFLLWIASVPGAAEFVECDSEYNAFDEFHIFHFDQRWLDPKLEAFFRRKEKFIVSEISYDHIFYVLERI